MPKTQYFTAAGLDGFIADSGNSGTSRRRNVVTDRRSGRELSVLVRAESGMPGTGQPGRGQG
jgi:hypothetical protein